MYLYARNRLDFRLFLVVLCLDDRNAIAVAITIIKCMTISIRLFRLYCCSAGSLKIVGPPTSGRAPPCAWCLWLYTYISHHLFIYSTQNIIWWWEEPNIKLCSYWLCVRATVVMHFKFQQFAYGTDLSLPIEKSANIRQKWNHYNKLTAITVQYE